jgi:D-lactate dehydrogenase
VLTTLAVNGTRLIALRCAGFNNVDLLAAQELGLTVVRVPAYSPSSVAEHTAGLILALNRKTCRAYNRVKDGNFSLEGLLGFNLQGRVVGIIGTGKIGSVVARIMRGFGCEVLAYDPVINTDCEKIGVAYVDLPELYSRSDIITLHCPLTNASYHMIHEHALGQMKDSVMLINTSRGAVVDTNAVITALKSGKVGYLGLDVYEQEGDLFFEDLSNNIIKDDVFERLLTFPNVVITGHQGFFTRDALDNIAHTTLQNITNFEQNGNCKNEVTPSLVVKSTL